LKRAPKRPIRRIAPAALALSRIKRRRRVEEAPAPANPFLPASPPPGVGQKLAMD
jgi:hypothetical protein